VDDREALSTLEVLVLDGQSTGATPAHGQLIEVGWHRFRAAGQPAPRPDEVGSALVALPPGVRLPRAVRELTGIQPEALALGGTEAEAWAHLAGAAGPAAATGPVPTIIHFAQFEVRFLEALHQAHGADRPYPFDVCCTHQIAQRLLPELPRRGLRALAGYFGFSPELLRRSAGHVAATCVVWQGLVAQLAEREIHTWPALRTWLATSPRPKAGRRVYPMPRERRLGLPDVPGVYRFLRGNGDVLYVGKATSLKKRVNSHFTKQGGLSERTLEMLSQARDLAVVTCATALEAALLETDEIKRLAPPYNVSLVEEGRTTWFASRDLGSVVPVPDAAHPVGPLPGRYAVAAAPALVEALTAPPGEGRARAVARAMGLPMGLVGAAGGALEAGLALFAARRPALGEAPALQDILQEARRLARAGPPPEVEREADVWDADRVCEHLEEALARVPALLARGRLLRRLQDAVVEFREPGEGEGRRLVLEAGIVVRAESTAAPPGAGAQRGPRAQLDIAGYDRLRVLLTELKRVLRDGGEARVSLGGRGGLAGPALARALGQG
jgi:DNA polymerase-3 subunit epsilon